MARVAVAALHVLLLTLPLVSCGPSVGNLRRIQRPEEEVLLRPLVWLSPQTVTAMNHKTPISTFPEDELESVANRRNVGIALQGGGTRAAVASVGVLRALYRENMNHLLKYASCVSGSCWTLFDVLYASSRKEKVSPARLLGRYRSPERLDRNTLRRDAEKGILSVLCNVSLNGMHYSAYMYGLKGYGTESQARVVRDRFLSPFRLGDEHRPISYSAETAQAAQDRAMNKGERAVLFIEEPELHPFPIANAVLIAPNGSSLVTLPFEFTPLYSGMPAITELEIGTVGGGWIETFAFDTAVRHVDLRESLQVTPEISILSNVSRHTSKAVSPVFSLDDILGTACAAPSELLAHVGLHIFGYTNARYIPPLAALKKECTLHTYDHEHCVLDVPMGDAGGFENTGVATLLARNATAIIVVLAPSSSDDTSDAEALFVGERTRVLDVAGLSEFRNFASSSRTHFRQRVKTVENRALHVAGDRSVELVWLRMGLDSEFLRRLPADMREAVERRDPAWGLESFPYLRTFEDFTLSSEAGALYAHLAAFITYQAMDDIKVALFS